MGNNLQYPNNITAFEIIKSVYPDMLLILTKDILVDELIYSDSKYDILLEKKTNIQNQPLAFVLIRQLASQIRNRIELNQKHHFSLNFNFSVLNKSQKLFYTIRLINSVNTEGKILCRIKEITNQHIKNKNLEYLVQHDSLTGLANRKSYFAKVRKEILACQSQQLMFGVLFIDLDRFKSINDALGHHCGDNLLIEIGKRLSKNLKINEYLARISGDEFTVLVTQVQDKYEIIETAKRILSIFKQQYLAGHYQIEIKPSIGISIYPNHGKTPDEITQQADAAMYQAKELGGNQIYLYDSSINTGVERNFDIDQGLRKAIKNNELFLDYQPQYSINDKKLIGLEALVRWQRDNNEIISPAEFIPVSELTGFIMELGLWIINTVCLQIKTWKKHNIPFKKIAINLSRRQLTDRDIVNSIFSIMSFHQIEGNDLVFEVTEDSLIKNNAIVMKNLNRLHDSGIKIAIDDFGTGYSSFSDLKKFPFSELKIDKSMIDEIGNQASDAIIKAIISMSSELNMLTVAEGVETKSQLNFLATNNCQVVQGYLTGMPLSVDKIENLLNS